MTSSVDKLAIKVGNLAIKVNKLNNRVSGLDIRVDNVSKQVDEFSTKLEEFATNLTDFMKKTNTNSDTILTVVELFKKHALQVLDIEREITGINESVDERFEKVDELSKKFKKVVDLVERNSRHIERLSGKIKGKGKERLNSESKTINIKDVESEFKSISKTLEDFTNPQLTSYGSEFTRQFTALIGVELTNKLTQDFKDLSEILKTLLTISKANSENITTLKESMGDQGNDKPVKPISGPDTEFKEDEYPSARMMELVGSFPTPQKASGSLLLGNESFCIFDGQTLIVYNNDGSLLREIKVSGTNWNKLSQHINDGNARVVLNNELIYLYDMLERQVYIYNTHGQYIETVKNKSVSYNGIISSNFLLLPLELPWHSNTHIGKYPKGREDGQLMSVQFSYPVTAKNGNTYITDFYGSTNDPNTPDTLRIQVFDSDGNFLKKLPIQDYSFKSGGIIIRIFQDELFILVKNNNYTQKIDVYNLDGKYLYCITAKKNTKGVYRQIKNFSITNSGDILISSNEDSDSKIYIYKRDIEYVQRPLERKYKIYSHSEVEKEINELDERKVKSVSFPLSIYQKYNLQPQIYSHNYPNLLTHTIYFQKPQSVKNAIKACEEYFNGPVTKSDFQDLQSHCLLGYVEGGFASRELNWATCNYNRLCRGYFLGGNVLSGVKITEDDELVLDITQD